jgi:hypothetical protein
VNREFDEFVIRKKLFAIAFFDFMNFAQMMFNDENKHTMIMLHANEKTKKKMINEITKIHFCERAREFRD